MTDRWQVLKKSCVHMYCTQQKCSKSRGVTEDNYSAWLWVVTLLLQPPLLPVLLSWILLPSLDDLLVPLPPEAEPEAAKLEGGVLSRVILGGGRVEVTFPSNTHLWLARWRRRRTILESISAAIFLSLISACSPFWASLRSIRFFRVIWSDSVYAALV